MKTINFALVFSVFILSIKLFAQGDPLGTLEMKKLAKGAVELGWKYFDKGDYDTALKRFEMAIRHDKNFAPGYYGVAYVYSIQGKLDDAIKYYRETLKHDQTYSYTFANLGYALLQKEKFEEALKMLDQALIINPNCGEAHYSYAQYYGNKENWKKAEESANKAIDCGTKLDPKFRKLLEKNGVKLNSQPTTPSKIPSHYI